MTSLTTSLENTQAETVRGIAVVAAGSAFIPLLDAFVKLLVTEHGMSAGEVALARFLLQMSLTLPLLLAIDGLIALRTQHIFLNLVRGACLGLGALAFFSSLRFLPLADATAIFLIQPMVVTLLSSLLLKETIGWRRVVAVLVGFAGALIIIRPSYAVFGLAALLPTLAAFLTALYVILTRRVSRGSTSLAMQFHAGLGGTLVLSAAMVIGDAVGAKELTFTWPQNGTAWALIAAVGIVGTLGHVLIVKAFRLAPASVLAPFTYIEVVSAVFLGFVIFGDLPDAPKWLGIAIVVGSGLFIYWREQRLARVSEKPPRTR
ncbi:DMT family transporter [Afifella pfennigii]|uniref:DMT family transporter n=1 Tax=Afifella pfennigii TaxID=209897 RepID=UPI000551B9F0|nr:DMT family transporter [Afifella pfennigii]